MEECVSDMTTSDNAGDNCEWYDARPGQYCNGPWNDDDFSVSEQCCTCGGSGNGVYAAITEAQETATAGMSLMGISDKKLESLLGSDAKESQVRCGEVNGSLECFKH